MGKFLIVLLFPFLAQAGTECEKHPIYCQIIKNKPSINRIYAMKLSNIIYVKSKEYQIDSQLMTAIFMQESGYDYKSKNCTIGLIFLILKPGTEDYLDCTNSDDYSKCVDAVVRHEKLKVCSDFGLGQIHYSNLENFDLNPVKLTTDLEYSVDAAYRIMNDIKKRYFKEEQYWWSRYNSSTPSYRIRYRKLVQRWI